MKRVSFLLCALLFSCHKQKPNVAYDSHLFAALMAHIWILDSDKIVRSNQSDTTIYPVDTIEQTTTFNSQQYVVRTVRDTTTFDSSFYQVIYDDPKTIYYYNMSGSLLPNQYFTIDAVDSSHLVLQGKDTTNLSSMIYYHAE